MRSLELPLQLTNVFIRDDLIFFSSKKQLFSKLYLRYPNLFPLLGLRFMRVLG